MRALSRKGNEQAIGVGEMARPHQGNSVAKSLLRRERVDHVADEVEREVMGARSMRAMVLDAPGPVGEGQGRLRVVELDRPDVGDEDVLIHVAVCGVCRTDLDIVEGRIEARHYPLVPGHQIVGTIAAVGTRVHGHREGDRVGVAWIHSACGVCRWCTTGFENLCPQFRSTGCDANGGYAEYAAASAAFIYDVPSAMPDAEVAPLLCAGAIGWRSLRLTNLRDGEPLGLTGFGASAHLVLQFARFRYPRSSVFVFARSAGEREFALSLGAAWAGDTSDAPPEQLSAIIDTTPAWKPVVEGLSRLAPGGRLVINAIRKGRGDQNELQRLDYATHLWMEREVKSVANVTRADVREALDAAVAIGLHPTVERLPLEQANDALEALANGSAIRGATVLETLPASL